MASRFLGLLAGLGVVLGVALAVMAPQPKAGPTVDAKLLGGELDAKIRETQTGVHARADTLANLPSLQASVATDAETVRDQTQTELAFRLNAGEHITIGQVPVSGGAPTVLLVLPSGVAPAGGLDKEGPRVELRDGKLQLVEVLSVTPKDEARAKELRGALAISWPIDTALLVQKLDATQAGLRVEQGGQVINLGAHASGAQDVSQPLPLQAPAARGLVVSAFVAPPPPPGLPLRPIGLGLALVSLVGVGLVLRGGKPAEVGGLARTLPSAASSNLAAADIGVGSTIQETYEITRLLGQGGMGAVWEARHLRLPDKRVAIKLLVGDNVQEELFARFRREAEITSKLGHPNIVGVLDFNTLPGGAPYIVLELLVGESLADRLKRGPLPLDQALDIATQIGSALHAAHRAEIVHRDLKPDNVFLVAQDGGREQVKVLDFGISKMRGNLSVKTQDSMVLGTPQYMSPEQANGKNSEVDARSDVWALGAIVYEMLTGQNAFPGDNIPQVMVKIVAEPSPSLMEVPGIPNHVASAVDQALSKAPEDRFPDVRSFIAALTGTSISTGMHDITT